jgi:hypothetical protein
LGEWLILSICVCGGGSRNWLFRTGIIFPGFLCSSDWWSFTSFIGALQINQDERLQEETFLLMKMASGGLPLIGNILGKALNRSNNSLDSKNPEH